ncbi:MAG TPA: hypothetical protein VN631_08810 [Negativicutes bacterium]|nr:hypothetical protein [Negativicutes bacterium]
MKKRILEIEARLSTIKGEAAKDDANIDALTKEAGDLQEERKGLLEQAEKRQKLLDSISEGGAGQVIRNFGDGPEARKYSAESPEYGAGLAAVLCCRNGGHYFAGEMPVCRVGDRLADCQ